MRVDAECLLVRGQRFIDISHLREHRAAVSQRYGVVRTYGQRRVKARKCVGKAFVPDKGTSSIDQRGDILGVRCKRTFEGRYGLIVPAEFHKSRAAIDLNVEALRRGSQCSVVVFQRFFEPMKFGEYDTAGIERLN